MAGFKISGMELEHLCGVRGIRKGFRWRNMKEDDLLEDLAVDGRVILK
jgi:hypothetical protein